MESIFHLIIVQGSNPHIGYQSIILPTNGLTIIILRLPRHFSLPTLPVALIFLVLHQTEAKSHYVVVQSSR